MGCANSKLENLPPVALCRDRCKFLDQALDFTHALVDSHSGYLHSLNTLGSSLHRLFHQHGDATSCRSTGGGGGRADSSSDSDSQIRSPSDSDEDTDEELGSCTREKTGSLPSGNLMFSNYDSARRGQSPPPPPAGSSWDFLNFFDTYERYEPIFNWDREGGTQKARTETLEKKKRSVVLKKDDVAKRHPQNSDVAKKLNQSEKKDDSKMGVSDVMRELKGSFEKASESGNAIFKLLSSGQRMSFCQDTRTTGSRGLSSTLRKLCVWERKLYLEVKAEEKLRMLLEKKCRQLKQLVEKKAEDRKVCSVRTLIRNLSIKLNVSVQVVDRISITISKLRDEEFLAEMTELIHGLLSMWKAMLECHKHQSQVLMEAKSFESVLKGKLDDVHLEAAMELKVELENWRGSFCNWITTQKNCIKALNGWLLRCLLYEPEPEETPADALLLPFSPARIGAPPVFVICHRWSEIMEKFSDKEVAETMHGLICTVDQLLEQQSADLQRMAVANKETEKKMKIKIKKTNQASSEVKTMAVTADTLHKASKFYGSEVQSGLKQIFWALSRFSGDSIKAYEELCATMEENNSQTRETKQPGP